VFDPAPAASALAICGDCGWAACAFEVEVATSPPEVWGGCWIAAAFGVGSATAWNVLCDCGAQPAKLAQVRAMKIVARTPAPAGLPTKYLMARLKMSPVRHHTGYAPKSELRGRTQRMPLRELDLDVPRRDKFAFSKFTSLAESMTKLLLPMCRVYTRNLSRGRTV
jgi:hypothetical protein